jgi:hypothetical protein
LVPRLDPATGTVIYPARRGLVYRPHWCSAQSTNTMASMMFRRPLVDLMWVPPDEMLQLYVDFYLATFACLLTGSIAIEQPLYAYRMHGANKHSNAVVTGGAYNTSTREWAPVRDAMLGLIQAALHARRDSIDLTFGRERRTIAEAAVAAALGATNMHGRGKWWTRSLPSMLRHRGSRPEWDRSILRLPLSGGR